MKNKTANSVKNETRPCNHPYISDIEKAMVGQTLTVPMMKTIMADYHPMNRPRNCQRLRALIRDIRNGAYKSNVGNWIKFDVNGNLIDGQKRIMAHIEENKPLTINVHFGLPPESILYIDRNQPRSIAANATLRKNIGQHHQPSQEEFSNDRLEYSIASWFKYGLKWNEVGASHEKVVWTEQELRECVEQDKRYIKMVQQQMVTKRPGTLGAIAVYATAFQEKATQFLNLLNGVSDKPLAVNHPISILKEYLKVKSNGGSAPIWDYYNTVRCINAFQAGRTMNGNDLSNERENFEFAVV